MIGGCTNEGGTALQVAPANNPRFTNSARRLEARMAVALSDDFQAFLAEYHKLSTVGYDAFKELWRACGMVRLIYACPPAISQAHYMQVCYSTALAFLMVEQPLNIRVAVVYILFFLHATQPRSCSLFFGGEGIGGLRAHMGASVHIFFLFCFFFHFCVVFLFWCMGVGKKQTQTQTQTP